MTIIKRLDVSHSESLLSLFKEADWSRNRTLEQAEQILENKNVFWVGSFENSKTIDEVLTGCAAVWTDGIFHAMIIDVIVSPLFRGNKTGLRLIENLIEIPEIKKIPTIELYTSTVSLSSEYYPKIGFQNVPSAVYMRLDKDFQNPTALDT